MIRDFYKPILVACALSIIFMVALLINNNIDNTFAKEEEISFDIKKDLTKVTPVEIALENTIIPAGEDINASLFSGCYFVLMVDESDSTVYAAKNAHKRIYPASMTKLVTAMVVCDKLNNNEISLDDEVTVDKSYNLVAEGGGYFELGYGSKITVKNLLYGLLIQSNNYYALMLADYVAGSEQAFCELMNKKAMEIGATNTHFANPHGLDNVNHYSSPYDIYLITKAAKSYELITTIDSFSGYTYYYTNPAGYEIETSCMATNFFMGDSIKLPSNFEIEVWKTGTTDGAGNCLTMFLTRDDREYIVIASNGNSKKELYDDIIKLVCLVK